MEIIGNIHKQKKEIEKVLEDTRQLHKEINSLTGRLDRSFTVADELIFSVSARFCFSRSLAATDPTEPTERILTRSIDLS